MKSQLAAPIAKAKAIASSKQRRFKNVFVVKTFSAYKIASHLGRRATRRPLAYRSRVDFAPIWGNNDTTSIKACFFHLARTKIILTIPSKEETMANAPKSVHKPKALSAENSTRAAQSPALPALKSKTATKAPSSSGAGKATKANPKTSAKSPKKNTSRPPVNSVAKTSPSKKTPTASKKKNIAAKPKASHGGFRPGAGRPKGSGKLGDHTSSMRTTPELHERLLGIRNALIAGEAIPGAAAELELFDAKVAAGFGVPSDESGSRRVDLYTLFSPRPETTFLVKVAGWSMREAGIHDGDYLLVDRSIDAKNGHVVVAHVEGQGLVAKRLRIDATGAFLDSENPDFKPIALGEGSQAKVWGVARAKAGLLI